VQALPAIANDEVARCGRCNRLLKTPQSRSHASFALHLSALLLWVPGCFLPLLTVTAGGASRTTNLIRCALNLWGVGYSLLGLLVVVLMIAVPSAFLLLLTLAEASPRAAHDYRRLAHRLRPWLMTEVFVVGGCVAYSRIQSVANVSVDAGGWCLAGSAMLLLGSLALRGESVPRAHSQPQPVTRSSEMSLQLTTALVIAGLLLYIPANLLPVLRIERYGAIQTNTILGGVVELVHYDLWPLAVIVFTASIVVPLVKLFGLSWLVWQTHRRSPQLLRQRTRAYRFIDTIGRWSNIDVFMISILAALMQFGVLTRVQPERGAIAFAAVVLVTMIASRCFDPRAMWRAVAPQPEPEPRT
jgi:paraquat-inducible protein A